MADKETREKFEKIVKKLKASRKFSALISSEEFFAKYKNILFLIPLLLEIISMIPSSAKMFNSKDIAIIGFSLFFVIGYVQVIGKVLSVLLNIDTIDGIFEWFRELHRVQENKLIAGVYAENLRKIANIGEFVMKLTAFAYGFTTVGFIFSNTTNQIVFEVPYIAKEFTLIHRLAGSLAYCYNVYNVFLSECTMIFIGIYFIGALNILSDVIGKLNESPNIQSAGNLLLPAILSLHVEILTKFDDFCQVFFFAFTIQLQTSVILILFNFYLLMQSIMNFFYWATLCSIFAQFALFCFFGQIIFNRSERIFTDLYQTKWYEMEISEKKALLLMMKNSQNAFGLKAAGMYDINMLMFVQVVKMSFSYCTIMYELL
uniref:Odorant receptor n=2 Tax=Lutzomyia longipalpis TaxID=7200 RepID=A0A240SXQ3_LUTLO